MTRRSARPPIDHAADRAKWVDLILQAHQAVEADTHEARSRLAERAVTARNVWTPPAPYPEGLIVQAFAQAAYGWGRQVNPALREGAAALMLQAAGLADQVITSAILAAETPGLAPTLAPTLPAARLPYADA